MSSLGTNSRAADVLASVDAGVITFTDEGRVLFANAAAQAILRRPNGCTGGDIGAVLAPLDRLMHLTGDDRRRDEVVVRCPDGASITVGYSVNRVCSDHASYWVVLFQDISAISELRAQRDRLLKLAAVGDVLPSVLHELRNPLAGITAMLEVLVEETGGDLQRDLHAVLWELRRMSLTLEGIGGFARPVRGRGLVAVDHAVRETCRILEPSAARAGVSLTCEGPNLPLLPLDRSAVNAVVFNLVKNAIDACRPDDEIRVTIDIVGDTFELVVRDTGRGMTPEQLQRCGELFFTTKPGGTGIGVALCRESARASGGDLTMNSEVDKGTTAVMRVPVTASEP